MTNQKQHLDNDEITFKELILKIQEFFREVLRYWYIVLFLAVLIGGYKFYQTYKMPINYSAKLTFMLNNDQGGGNAIGGFAASLGLGGSKGDLNLDKIHALLKSRNIIQRGLFKKTNFNGKEDYFANHLIELYNLRDYWKKNIPDRVDFRYNNVVIEEFSPTENSVLKGLYGMVIGTLNFESLLKSSIDDDTGIMTMMVRSTNPEFSIRFVDTLYSELGRFYIDKTIEKQQKTFEITKNRVDSIRKVLNSLQIQLLKFQDSQRNTTLKQYRAKELELQREFQASASAYGELIKQQEIASFALDSKTPFIQSIDKPIPPLAPDKHFRIYVKQIK